MPEENLEATVDAVAVEATPGNCSGGLVELPDVPGTTYHSYECQTCHQIIHVGDEDLAENGLPTQHSPVIL